MPAHCCKKVKILIFMLQIDQRTTVRHSLWWSISHGWYLQYRSPLGPIIKPPHAVVHFCSAYSAHITDQTKRVLTYTTVNLSWPWPYAFIRAWKVEHLITQWISLSYKLSFAFWFSFAFEGRHKMCLIDSCIKLKCNWEIGYFFW